MDDDKMISQSEAIENYLSEGNYLPLHTPSIKAFGKDGAMILSLLIYKYKFFREKGFLTEDGFFYFHQSWIEREIGLMHDQQTEIVRKLEKLGVLITKLAGLPRRKYYKIDIAKILEYTKKITAADTVKPANKMAEITSYVSRPQRHTYHAPSVINNKKEYNKKELSSFSYEKEGKLLPSGKSYSSTRINRIPKIETPPKPPNPIPSYPASIPAPIMRIPFRQPITAPRRIQSLIDTWNNLGLCQHKNPNTKIYAEIVSALKKLLLGRYFDSVHSDDPLIKSACGRRFSEEEITQAFIHLKNATLSGYEPHSGGFKDFLKHTSMIAFLFHSVKGYSLFLQYLNKPPQLIGKNLPVIDDKYPIMSGAFRSFYRKEVLGGVRVDLTNHQENKMRHAGIMAMDFYQRYKHKLVGMTNARDFAGMVCEALRSSVNGNMYGLEIGHFCSERTWGKIVPAYLHSQAALLTEELG